MSKWGQDVYSCFYPTQEFTDFLANPTYGAAKRVAYE